MASRFQFQFQLHCQLHGNSNHNFFPFIPSPLPPQQQQRRRLHNGLVLRCRSSNINSNGGGGSISKKVSIPNSNYVVPLDKSPFSSSYSSCITRPLAEILRDLNKRLPDSILFNSPRSSRDRSSNSTSSIPWYHANRMLSFYAPGWCGEVRDVIYSENGRVTVVYRVTIRGSDGEAYRESTGTASATTDQTADLVATAEEIAFCKTCARFGLGLYLYHEE